jgi:hypothetical protein
MGDTYPLELLRFWAFMMCSVRISDTSEPLVPMRELLPFLLRFFSSMASGFSGVCLVGVLIRLLRLKPNLKTFFRPMVLMKPRPFLT